MSFFSSPLHPSTVFCQRRDVCKVAILWRQRPPFQNGQRSDQTDSENLITYIICVYIYISIDTKMKMIMSKSSFCCFISSCGGLQFFILFQKSYPIFCLDTRYTPSRALLAAVMMFIPRSRLVWLIISGVQKRTGFNQYIKTYQYPTSTSSIMFSPSSIMFGSWSVIPFRSSLDH